MDVKVFVVEDEEQIRSQLLKDLENLGVTDVTLFENGQLAHDKLSGGEHPDLMICDIVMPIMDGLTLLKNVREELSLDFPIMMLTSKSEKEKVMTAVSYGVKAYLVKPWTLETLGQKLLEAMT